MIRSVLAYALLAACGSVSVRGDAAVGSDGTLIDGATDGATDTMAMLDAPTGPAPQLRWNFESNLDNAGAVSGYTFTAPAGISYVSGKTGMAASFGGGQYASVTGIRGVLGTFSKVTIAMWLEEPGNLSSAAVLDVINRTASPYGGVQLGFSSTLASLCVATTSNSLLGGGCGGPTAPSANTFHHWILRYNGTGLGSGQGANLDVYVDDVLVYTQANDSSNNPVFTSAIPDTLYIGAAATAIDDLRIYNQVFTTAEQCTFIIGGTYSGTTCTLP